jgi:solute carrier family 25 (adenine nucleotide translocator) protein 4/5/6/31
VIRYFPTQALNFAFKNFYKKHFSLYSKGTSFWDKAFVNVASGSVAGASTQFFVYPMDYTRTRLTNDIQLAKAGHKRQFDGIIDCMRKTYQSDGMRGLYRGFVVSCIFMMIYRGFYFGLNDSIKPMISKETLDNMFINFALGYAITITSGMVAYPLDTVRRRMMMSSGENHRFTSSIECIKQLYKENSRSFYGGAGANILRGVTGAGVLTIYDKIQLVVFGKTYATGEG